MSPEQARAKALDFVAQAMILDGIPTTEAEIATVGGIANKLSEWLFDGRFPDSWVIDGVQNLSKQLQCSDAEINCEVASFFGDINFVEHNEGEALSRDIIRHKTGSVVCVVIPTIGEGEGAVIAPSPDAV